MKSIDDNIKNLKEGEVKIYSDYKKVVNKINNSLLNDYIKATKGL